MNGVMVPSPETLERRSAEASLGGNLIAKEKRKNYVKKKRPVNRLNTLLGGPKRARTLARETMDWDVGGQKIHQTATAAEKKKKISSIGHHCREKEAPAASPK